MSQTKIKTGLLVLAGVLLLGAFGWSAWANISASRNASVLSATSTPGAATGTPAQSPSSASGDNNPSNANRSSNGTATRAPDPTNLMPSIVEKIADKSSIMDHMAYGRSLGIAFITYANKHHGELPSDIYTVSDQMKGATQSYSYKIVRRGSFNDIKHPEQTVMLKEDPFPISNDQWARAYVYADGHVVSATSYSSDFSVWESEHPTGQINP